MGDGSQIALSDVAYWAYNIQDVDSDRQYEELVGTHFDLYVLEVTTTETGNEDFDIGGLIHDIRQHNLDYRGVDPIFLAYVDVGQAEDWRWYYEEGWTIGDPEWIVATDPNNWEGNYPVAFWHQEWEDIVIYGDGENSHVNATLDAGFDGIYMDWIEAYSDERVIDKVAEDFALTYEQAEEKSSQLMFDFIDKIGTYARTEADDANPDYLVVTQNASDLYVWDPDRFEEVNDGIALEAIWWDGDGGFDNWNDSDGYNLRTNKLYPNWTEEVLSHLDPMKGRLPIFCVEYAQDMDGDDAASQVYDELAPKHGFIPYASRRSLARLSTTPHPPGYGKKDY